MNRYGRILSSTAFLILSGTLLSACGGSSEDPATLTPQSLSGLRAAGLQDQGSTGLSGSQSGSQGSSSIGTGTHTGTAATSTSEPIDEASDTGTHALTLTWSAPEDNADGTPLVDLSGYKIHYGTRAGSYSKTVTLSNPSLSRYVVENLASGTYYFAISAYNQAGSESQLSGELATTVD